jgi:hypothetical protein
MMTADPALPDPDRGTGKGGRDMRKLMMVLAAATLTTILPQPAVAQQKRAASGCRDGKNRWITVRNNSSTTIMYVKMALPGTAFGGDLLGSDVIAAGDSHRINFERSDCACSLLVRAENGDDLNWDRVMNVCTESEWLLGD